MITILSNALGYVVTAILSALGGWILKVIHIWWQDRQETAANEAKVAAAQKALEDAKTKQELDDAAKNIAGNFGG